MCGIAGYFLWGTSEAPDLITATHLLRHRGPDAARTWQSADRKVGLAHTRLSILDLSEAAHQPFQLGTTWIVYNGEVYNFQRLAQEGGFRPRTRSDTEVLLWAYHKWGEAFVERLEGMFAFALYDEDKNHLLLARDPFGIKPLWVAVRSEGIYFASELKVLRAWFPTLQRRPAAVAEFLHLGFIPAPHSWYEGVYKVLPGELWRINLHGYERQLYYDRQALWQRPKLTDTPLPAIEEAVESELRRAIREHLISDVPVGLFLSGGTDSSLVAALAVAEGHRLRAFSIGFAESSYNELPYAQAVAKHLGIPIEYEILHPDEALHLIPQVVQWYDEPFGDVSALPTYLVSRLAARHVKVVLAGDGGDELFWGYGRYRWAQRLKYGRLAWQIGALALSVSGSSRLRRVSGLLHLPTHAIPEHIFSQEQYTFSWREIQHLLQDALPAWKTPYALPSDSAEAQAAWDFLHYLPDDLLTKVDRASMQHSLEVRVPLLDKRWVAIAWQVPNTLKVPQGGKAIQYKPLLRRILRKHLPAYLVERKKWGFTIPLADWIAGPLQEWVRTYTASEVLKAAYGIRGAAVEKLWRRFLLGERFLAMRLWLLAQIGHFAQD